MRCLMNNDSWWKQEVIEIEAKGLAKMHGLDEQRVIRIFEKLNGIKWYAPNFPQNTAFDEALKHLEPNRALDLFEKYDLIRLATKVYLNQYLTNLRVPFYTLKELTQLTEDVIDHLYANKESLIKTGFPKKSFNKSFWLDWHLNKLYFTKLPAFDPLTINMPLTKEFLNNFQEYSPRLSIIDVDENDNYAFDYLWINEVISTGFKKEFEDNGILFQLPAAKIDNEDLDAEEDEKSIKCKYEEAPHLDFFSKEEVIRLEEMRNKIFEIKVKVLLILKKRLMNRNADRMLEECFDVINEELDRDDKDFLLRMDQLLSDNIHIEPMFYTNILYGVVYKNAGLTELIHLIGHYNKEIEISTMDETKRAVSEIPIEKLPESYYQAYLGNHQEELSNVFYYYSRLENKEDAFFKKYHESANNMLKEPGSSIGKKYYTHQPESIEQIDQLFKKYLGNTGNINGLPRAVTEPATALKEDIKEEYRFKKRKGDYWDIAYEGEEILLKDLNGLKFIAYLLADPKNKKSAYQLYSLVNNPIDREISNDELERNKMSVRISGSEHLTGEKNSYAYYSNMFQELNEEIDKYTKLNDIKTVKEIEEEKETIMASIEKEYGITSFNKPSDNVLKKIDDADYKKARDNVSKSIRYAINRIKEELPALADHLDKSIYQKYGLTYEPSFDIKWQV